MADIIDFKEASKQKKSGISEAEMPSSFKVRTETLKCLTCKHETVSTLENGGSPEGLECPECGCFTMVYKDLTTYAPAVYSCSCGSTYFSLHPTFGLYCVRCGTFHN